MSRMSGRKRILSEGGTTRYSEIGRLVVDQIGDREIAGRRVLGHEGIAVKRQRRFGRAEDAAKIPFLFVEHFLYFLPDDGVRGGFIAGGHPPVMLVIAGRAGS